MSIRSIWYGKSTKFTVKIIYKGEIYEQLPHNHLIYSPELKNKLTKEDFILRSNEIHNVKYNYDLLELIFLKLEIENLNLYVNPKYVDHS